LSGRDLSKAALRGEASYLWRAGQERRLNLILQAAGDRAEGRVLDNGCGVGAYLQRLAGEARAAHGLEFDEERAGAAAERGLSVVQAASERLPFAASSFDLILSHEVLEHVADDRSSMAEAARALRPGGRLVLFVPNRGYPFETHGIYWGGRYHFGNIPLVNYLPTSLRNRLAPHVRAYTAGQITDLMEGLPFQLERRTVIFGAYDNLIARFGPIGRVLRAILQALEATPLRVFGLSHFWVLEKRADADVGEAPGRLANPEVEGRNPDGR
jgi:SAM-dependent methyltransferase